MKALLLLGVAACLSKPGAPGNGPGDGGTGDGTMIDTPPPSGGFQTLAVGDDHACAIDAMQRLYCWGRADFGQLGNLPDATSSPTLVSQDAGWSDVALGAYHSCGILNGKARCWGNDSVAQADHGTISDDLDLGTFQPVKIFARDGGTCALDANGKLMCWGGVASFPPVEPTALVLANDASLQFSQIAFTDDHACALTVAGAAICWGHNESGQIGTNAPGPVMPQDAVPIAGKTFSKLAVGGLLSCGVRKTDQAIDCWGSSGEPMYPVGGEDHAHPWTDLVVGFDFACGIAAGELRCWGFEEYGQTGAGILDAQSHVPTNPSLTNALGVGVGDDFGCALTSDHNVSCWGQNRYGNLGNGQIARVLAPVEVFGSPARAIAVGESHACLALENSGDTYCWGDNRDHRVHPTDSAKFFPAPHELTQKLTMISAGRAHNCGLIKDTDHPFCWGSNSDGQLGGGSTSTTFFEVNRAFSWLSAGDLGTCGISANKVYCWGNIVGVASPSTDVALALPMKPWTQVVLGDSHVLVTDGTSVYGWGNACAATGVDSADISIASARMVDLPGTPTALDLATGLTGGSDSCVLYGTTELACWGKNEQGELLFGGDGSSCLLPFTRTSAVASIGASDANHLGGKLTMRGDHGCVLSTDSNAVCWGDDNEREIGTRPDSAREETLLVPFPTVPYSSIALGNTVGCGIRSNDGGNGKTGHVECWGTSPYGELGNGTMFVGTPMPVLP